MTTGPGPTTVRRRLRAELRGLRLAKGLSIEQATNAVEWSPSKLIRIENGQVGISVSDLAALLQVYGVDDSGRVEELKELARATRQRTWWARFQRYLPSAYQEFIGAESDASWIGHYHPTFIPGLLQTEAYALAIIHGTALTRLPDEVVTARLEVRMLRQRHVLDRADPPRYVAILDEVALRRTVGKVEMMRGQLDHLLDIAGRPMVDLMMVPFEAGPHPGWGGTFALMEYDLPASDGVVFLETPSGDVALRDDPNVITEYQRMFGRLMEIALPGPRTIEYIREARKNFE